MLTENRVGTVRQMCDWRLKCSLISVRFFATEHKINIMMESWLYGEVKEIKTDSNHLRGKSDEIVMTRA